MRYTNKYLIDKCGYLRLYDYFLKPKKGAYRKVEYMGEFYIVHFYKVLKTRCYFMTVFSRNGVYPMYEDFHVKKDLINPLNQYNVTKIRKKDVRVLEVLYG